MNRDDVIRAWKDPRFRASLSREQQSALPPHPAGTIELRDEDLKSVPGGLALTLFRASSSREQRSPLPASYPSAPGRCCPQP